MLSRLLRRWSPAVLGPIVRRLAAAGITANQLTIAGLALAVAAGVLAGQGELIAAAVTLLLSGLLDSLDGELARQSGTSSAFGAFLDSIADHYGDFAVYFGIAWITLQAGDRLTVLLVLAAMFGSIVGSHIRSRAGMMALDTKDVGFFTRAERIAVLVVGLASGFLTLAAAILALAHNLSALQRLAYVAKNSK
jgi:CDP-diacylglycerol--glycerol-3-phosphate 3-phosphatidyltransferase